MGIGAYEILCISLICLTFAIVLLSCVLKSDETEKYQVMANNARLFGISSISYGIEDYDSIYLGELVQDGLISRIKNSFSGEVYCDPYQSKVEFQMQKKFITLQCGNYLIKNQYIASNSYDIYKVGEWKKGITSQDDDQMIGYNYYSNGSLDFGTYYEEDAFLYLFNLKNDTYYKKIEDIPNRYQVVKSVFSRKIKKVGEASPE